MKPAARRTLLCAKPGRKIHLGVSDCSSSHCGYWFKANTAHFEVTKALYSIPRADLCENCFDPKRPAVEVFNFWRDRMANTTEEEGLFA